MAQGDRESMTDSDPHGLLFGTDDADLDVDHDLQARPSPLPRGHHGDYDADYDGDYDGDRDGDGGRHRSGHERSHTGRFLLILLVLVVLVGGVAVWAIPKLFGSSNDDYSGSGSGTAVVVVHDGDSLSVIGQTLEKAGVVKSVGAFTDAAKSNPAANGVQAGTYRLTKRVPAKTALAQLLDPAYRVKGSTLAVPEGSTIFDIEKRLESPVCKGTVKPAAGTVCGLGLSKDAVTKALRDVGSLGLPTDYTIDGKAPASAEGFLFPATYNFDRTSSVADLLQQMVSKFTDQVRVSDFTSAAQTLHITPYKQLIIASIAQSEANNAKDFARVARVILNRIDAGMPLKVDATSRYGAVVAGTDPAKINYSTYASPYNTYLHGGLPPTPISNPGDAAMKGAAHPARGNWLYYVNGDAQGDLAFFHSDTQFEQAQLKCYQHHWGCAKP